MCDSSQKGTEIFMCIKKEPGGHRPHSLPFGDSFSISTAPSSCREAHVVCKGQKNPDKGILGVRKYGCCFSWGSGKMLAWPALLGGLFPSGGRCLMGFCPTGEAWWATCAFPCCSLLFPESTFVSIKNKMRVDSKHLMRLPLRCLMIVPLLFWLVGYSRASGNSG